MNTGDSIDVSSTSINRQWLLAARPVDRAVRESDFRLGSRRSRRLGAESS